MSKKLTSHNKLNFALLKEVIEIITAKYEIYNNMTQSKIDNRCHKLLRMWKESRENFIDHQP